jgi:Flp pilus assembly protein TadG
MRRFLHPHRDDRGLVALEFVLALPLLLMLIVGTVVLGNFLSIKTQTAGLARDGARAAALHRPLPTGASVVGTPCPTPSDPTKFVTVQAIKNVSLRSFPLVPVDFLPATTTESVTMRCGG